MARFSYQVRQLLNSLIIHNKLVTTESRAKTLKKEAERLISRSKRLDLTVRRRVLALFPKKQTALKFLEQIMPQFRERVGGYVRVVKLPHRRGDQAPLARVEFVEEIKEQVKPSQPAKEEVRSLRSKVKKLPAEPIKEVKAVSAKGRPASGGKAVKRGKGKNGKNKSDKRN